MTSLLLKCFVKHSDRTRDPAVRAAYGTLAAATGIVLNLLLFAGKFTVSLLFGAISIRADSFNNLSDAGSQLVSLIFVRLAAKPADRKHPFGHGRIEYMASMAVSVVILFIAYQLFIDSLGQLISGEGAVEFSILTVIVLAASIAVKLWLALFNRKLGRAIDSAVMRATAADSLSDAVATGAVLVALLVSRFVALPFSLDAAMGVIVSVFVAIAGIRILLEAKDAILGEAPAGEIIEQIQRIVATYPEALGIHDMMVHNYGPGRTFASLHIEVDGSADIFYTHDIIDNIERQLRENGIDATIHMDPIVTDDEEVRLMREATAAVVAEIEKGLKIHDFRFVRGETHTNLIFDLVIPYECTRDTEELIGCVKREIAVRYPNHFAVISIDRG